MRSVQRNAFRSVKVRFGASKCVSERQSAFRSVKVRFGASKCVSERQSAFRSVNVCVGAPKVRFGASKVRFGASKCVSERQKCVSERRKCVSERGGGWGSAPLRIPNRADETRRRLLCQPFRDSVVGLIQIAADLVP